MTKVFTTGDARFLTGLEPAFPGSMAPQAILVVQVVVGTWLAFPDAGFKRRVP
jgi:hypothetical protein